MGHEDRTVNYYEAIKEITIYRGLPRHEKGGDQHYVDQGEERCKEFSAVEYKTARMQFVGDHIVMDPVMEQQA